MDLGWLVVLVFIAVVMSTMVRLVARGPEVISGMFHAEQLGWPPGVQEDDDLRWCWPDDASGPGTLRRRRARMRVATQRVRGTIRLCPGVGS